MNEKNEFLKAIRKGDIRTVNRFLLDKKFDPGATAIKTAIETGNLDIVKRLLNSKKVNPTINNNSIFIQAVRDRNDELVEILLKDGRVFSHKSVEKAVNDNNLEFIEILSKIGKIDVIYNNYSLLNIAAEKGNGEMFKLLLRNYGKYEYYNLKTPLSKAIINDNLEIIEIIFKEIPAVIHINYVMSALKEINLTHNFDILRYLIEKFDHLKNDIFTEACEEGYTEIVKFFLDDFGFDPSFNENISFRESAEHCRVEIVKLLLKDKRVNPASLGNNAIINASRKGCIEVVKILLDDPRVNPSDNNNSAIKFSISRNYIDIFKLLLNDYRMDPSSDHDIILRDASIKGNLQIVKLLLKNPLVGRYIHDPNYININEIRQNLDFANPNFRENYIKIIELLEEDMERYPNYESRKYNVEVENLITSLEFKLRGLEKELESLIKVYGQINKSNNIQEIMLRVNADYTQLHMDKIKKEIRRLRREQSDFNKNILK